MIDLKTITHASKIPVGVVRINKPFTSHNASFETAAWWEDTQSNVGVHPVYLSRNYLIPHNLYLYASVSGKVIDDNFAALWGGVPISNQPYMPKNVGGPRTIKVGIEILDAIKVTGTIPHSEEYPVDKDWFIDPRWWPVFMQEAQEELVRDYERLPEFWHKFSNMNPETYEPSKSQKELRMDGYDELDSRVSMVAYCGGLLEKWGRRIQEINRALSYHRSNGRNASDYNRNLFAKNTAWAKDITVQEPT